MNSYSDILDDFFFENIKIKSFIKMLKSDRFLTVFHHMALRKLTDAKSVEKVFIIIIIFLRSNALMFAFKCNILRLIASWFALKCKRLRFNAMGFAFKRKILRINAIFCVESQKDCV